MRVSTLGLHNQGLSSILQLQSANARTQLEIATGKQIFTPGDDPQGMSRAMQLTRVIADIDQYQDNSTIARHRLSLEDVTLGELVDRMQRVNELAVQANNATESNETRAIIGAELREIRDHLLQLANSGDGEGGHLFSGFRSSTSPFALNNGSVSYLGDQGQRELQIGSNRFIADGDHGQDVFLAISNGNGRFTTAPDPANSGTGIIDAGSVVDVTAYDSQTYSIEFLSATDYEVIDTGSGSVISTGVYDPDSDTTVQFAGVEVGLSGAPEAGDTFTIEPSTKEGVFAMMDNFITAVETGVADGVSQAQLNNRMNDVLTDLDQIFSHFTQLRTSVGARLNAIDAQSATNDAHSLQLEAVRSGIEDVDMVEAIARLDLQSITLEAASQSFVSLQRLSLFNYLG